MHAIRGIFVRYKAFRPLPPNDAWFIFRVAAIAEAAGWTMLILGIAARELTSNPVGVQVAGRLHGVLFILYILACIALGPSLRFGLYKIIVAGLCSVPPFGSVAFERYATISENIATTQRLCILTYVQSIAKK